MVEVSSQKRAGGIGKTTWKIRLTFGRSKPAWCEQIPKELKGKLNSASRHQCKRLGPYSAKRGKTTMCLRQEQAYQLFVYVRYCGQNNVCHHFVSNKCCPSNHQLLPLPLIGAPQGSRGWRKDDATLPWIAKMHIKGNNFREPRLLYLPIHWSMKIINLRHLLFCDLQ